MAETARFLLFNINVLNRGLPRILPALLAEAGGADVLVFNEVTPGLEKDLLASTGEPWATVDGPSSHFVGILPFRMSIHVREGGPLGGLELLGSFSVGQWIATIGGRHVLAARVRGSGGSMLLALTHLSPEMPFAAGMRSSVRARQLELLTTHLLALRQPEEPIVLAGDFNYSKPGGREVEHERAAELLGRTLDLVDVARQRAGAGRAADTWPARGHFDAGLGPQRMDLFYLSRSLVPRVRDLTVHEWSWKRSGSDHMAVSMVLDLSAWNA